MRPPANPNTQLHRFLKDGIYKALTAQSTLPYHLRTTIDGDTPDQPIDLTSPPLSPAPGQGSSEGVDSASSGPFAQPQNREDVRDQLVPDLSSQQHSQGASEGEITFCPTDPNQRLPDSPGAAPRRRSTSPHRPVATQEGNSTPKLFRLRCWEAWQLPTDAQWLWDFQLSHQGRYDTDFVWTSTGPWFQSGEATDRQQESHECYVWTPFQIELVDYDYDSYTIWVLRKRGARHRPWILFAGKAQDSRVHYLVGQPTSQYQVFELEGAPLQWGGHQYQADCRLVELEYQEVARFQTGAALHQWAYEFQENFPLAEVIRLSENIRDPSGRFLRPVSTPGAGIALDGRIQGPEDDSISESDSSRSTDDSQDQRSTEDEAQEHSLDCSEQLDDSPMLSQSSGEDTSSGGSLTDSLSGSDSDGPFGSGQHSLAYSRPRYNARYTYQPGEDYNTRPTKRARTQHPYHCWKCRLNGGTSNYSYARGTYYCKCTGRTISYLQ